MGNNMSQFNAGQANNMGQFNAGQTNNMGQFNAGQQNAMGMFNSGQSNALNNLQIQQANQMAMQNAQNGMQAANLNNTFANDQASREANAIQMMLGTGNQQQAQVQQNLNVPYDMLGMMLNAGNQTATAGRETYGTSQSSSSGSGFNFGLPWGK
jgi:hypothetical protein